jgi:deazaflavin-dependent oxidoreductase (nitroreductase family)
MVLTTTGAKTGLSRRSPLATLPMGDGVWYVVGSNMGGSAHPGWSANLLKTPRATVVFHGKSTEVDAHLLDEADKTETWPKLRAVWPTYDHYAQTAGRDLRVFRLTSTT